MYVNIKYCVLANYKAPKTLCNFYMYAINYISLIIATKCF